MKLIPALVPTLVLALSLVTLAEPPQQAAPAPPASGPHSAPSPPPPSATVPPPGQPMIPISPKDPASTRTLLKAIQQLKDLQQQQNAYITEANKHLQELQASQQAYSKIAQDEIADIKKSNSWGDEVQFNPQTEKFERPLKTAGAIDATKDATKTKLEEKKEEKK